MRSDAKTPQNIQPNAPPRDGFVLSVDRKFKTRYETADEAVSAADKLKANFPAIDVAIFDVINKTYTAVVSKSPSIAPPAP